jgi:ribosomal protein L25 (general stress protein Ctc)
MAAKVMRMPDPAIQQPIQRQTGKETEAVQMQPLVNSITPLVQRSSGKKEEVQMKPGAQRASDGSSQASGSVEKRLAGSKGGGSPLPKDVRSFMESRFGADFSSVRVHTDSNAVQMNKEVGAQAFAHGSDIYYGAGKSPGKNELTAHELTHTIQQGGAVPTKSVTQQEKKENKLQAKADAIQLTSVEPKIQGMGNSPSQPAAAKVPPQTPTASPAAMMASGRLGLVPEKVKGIVKGRSPKIIREVQPHLDELSTLESAMRRLGVTLKRKRGGDDTDREIESKKNKIAKVVQTIITKANIAAHEVKPVIPQERFDIFVKDSDFAPVDMTANPRFNGNGYNYSDRKSFVN